MTENRSEIKSHVVCVMNGRAEFRETTGNA